MNRGEVARVSRAAVSCHNEGAIWNTGKAAMGGGEVERLRLYVGVIGRTGNIEVPDVF
jgi:hypothetical protein